LGEEICRHKALHRGLLGKISRISSICLAALIYYFLTFDFLLSLPIKTFDFLNRTFNLF